MGIIEQVITNWEDKEQEKEKQLQEKRLNNIRLRNYKSKNEKILRKKEELAEGLHLIDFEQLKIENQTLQEKIDERDDDISKLSKKILNNREVMMPTMERMQCEEK